MKKELESIKKELKENTNVIFWNILTKDDIKKCLKEDGFLPSDKNVALTVEEYTDWYCAADDMSDTNYAFDMIYNAADDLGIEEGEEEDYVFGEKEFFDESVSEIERKIESNDDVVSSIIMTKEEIKYTLTEECFLLSDENIEMLTKAMRENLSENLSELCNCVIDTVHAVIDEVREGLES